MKQISISTIVYHSIRLGLGVVFFYAGITKLLDLSVFTVTIEAYGIIPETLVMPVAILLPIIEVVAAIGLMLDTPFALEVITGLLVLFIGILTYGIHLGLDIDCGCFGPEDPEAEAFSGMRTALYRDFIFSVGIVYLYCWRFYNKRYSSNMLIEEEVNA